MQYHGAMTQSEWVHVLWIGIWSRIGATLIMLALAGSLAHAASLAAPVPGLIRLIPATRHPIMFFGEYHGSNQSPAFFGDAVAEVSAGEPVLVILEQNQSEARLVSQYVDRAPASAASDRATLPLQCCADRLNPRSAVPRIR